MYFLLRCGEGYVPCTWLRKREGSHSSVGCICDPGWSVLDVVIVNILSSGGFFIFYSLQIGNWIYRHSFSYQVMITYTGAHWTNNVARALTGCIIHLDQNHLGRMKGGTYLHISTRCG